MRAHFPLIVTILVLTAGLAGACDSDNGADTGDGENGPTPSASVPLTATVEGDNGPNGAQRTPTEFEALRDALLAQLDAIGVNIAAVPNDVRDQVLASCHDLEAYVEGERVADMCEAIEQAIERGDPGLIDLVVDQLADLEGT